MKFDQTNEHVVTKLQDLQPNDKIKGMDNNKNLVNNCEIVSVSKIGIGTVLETTLGTTTSFLMTMKILGI